MKKIKYIIDLFFIKNKKENIVIEYNIKKIWYQINPTLKKITKDIYYKDSKLFIIISEPELKNNLLLKRTKIKNYINKKLNKKIIKECLFV